MIPIYRRGERLTQCDPEESQPFTIRTAPHRRQGWDDAFATMAKHQDDVLLDEVTPNHWDPVEWEW